MPAAAGSLLKVARARTGGGSGVPCDEITDRVACCSATDGVTGAPCIPATTRFFNGAVCETADHVVNHEVSLPDDWRLPAAPPPPAPPPITKVCDNVLSTEFMGGNKKFCGIYGQGDQALFGGNHQTYSMCQNKCVNNPECNFFMWWKAPSYISNPGDVSYCATSKTCDYRTQQGYLMTVTSCSTVTTTSSPPPPPPSISFLAGLTQTAASCAELGGSLPLTSELGEEASVAHHVQRLTLTQPSPAKLTQRLVFTVIGCPANTDCIGDEYEESAGEWSSELPPAAVKLLHNGKLSSMIKLKNATAAEIGAAFGPLQDATYSGLVVTSIEVGSDRVVWDIELRTSWSACKPTASPSFPLLIPQLHAKMNVTATIIAGASCLEGGVDVTVDGGDTTAYMPWDATAEQATAIVNGLLGATTASDGVYVARGGDGHGLATFTVTYLRGGHVATPIQATSSSSHPLTKRVYPADYATAQSTTTTVGVGVAVETVAPGGIDVLPLPGRYVSAPSDQLALRLRLSGQTTARCAAPNWHELHVGCFNVSSYSNRYAGLAAGDAVEFVKGFSLERCARHCSAGGVAPAAVAFAAALDTCTCLSAAELPSAALAMSDFNCTATCSSDGDVAMGSQMCGEADGAVPRPPRRRATRVCTCCRRRARVSGAASRW